jgi:hypothetical protein
MLLNHKTDFVGNLPISYQSIGNNLYEIQRKISLTKL